MSKDQTPNAFTIPKSFLANDRSFKRSSAGTIGGKVRAQNMGEEQIRTFVIHIDKITKVNKK
tara:strand:- start:4582 stop:4767 length:186 start_codon:yes stop_codon:yes gene_type:complete